MFLSNPLIVASVNLTSEIVMVLGRLSICGVAGFAAFGIIQKADQFQPGGKDEITKTWLIVGVS